MRRRKINDGLAIPVGGEGTVIPACVNGGDDVHGSPNRRDVRGVSSRVRRRVRSTGEAVPQDHSPPEIAGQLEQFFR
jgi:hypothetical protein